MARQARVDEVAEELRELLVRAAPDPEAAAPVRGCPLDAPLDAVIPFSSVIVLGAVIAVEDRYRVRVTRAALEEATRGGATLRGLARMIAALERGGPT